MTWRPSAETWRHSAETWRHSAETWRHSAFGLAGAGRLRLAARRRPDMAPLGVVPWHAGTVWAVAVFLVRHAHAVSRQSWDGPDDPRPLSKRGIRQARGLAKLLGDHPIRRILASPAARCVATVAPLADALSVPVAERPELREGAATQDALDLLRDAATRKGDSVVCCHGDLIPELLWALAAKGATLDGNHRWEKGSTWALEWDGNRAVGGRYLPPVEA